VGAAIVKITVVGAILIVATVLASVLLLLALDETKNQATNKQNGDPPQDQPLRNRRRKRF
jgi:hypothetical protein